jgi:hypothetical protein
MVDVDPVGREGTLTIGTRGSGGPGEVSVAIRGGRETFIAYSDQPISQNANVLIIESNPSRAVRVVEWPLLDP